MTPMPSSSRVSRSRNNARIRFIRSRSVVSWSSQVSVAANWLYPVHLAFDFAYRVNYYVPKRWSISENHLISHERVIPFQIRQPEIGRDRS